MNLPNKLTVFRMLLVPIIIGIWLLGEGGIFVFTLWQSEFSLTRLLCLVLFVIASLTDLFDGRIARKRKTITTFGKFMDPIADKMLVNTLLILMAYQKLIPLICVLIMILRDLIVDAIRLLAAEKQQVVAAGNLGKLKTVLQMTAIIIVLLDNFPLAFLHIPFGLIATWLATLVSVVSGIDYFRAYQAMIFESL